MAGRSCHYWSTPDHAARCLSRGLQRAQWVDMAFGPVVVRFAAVAFETEPDHRGSPPGRRSANPRRAPCDESSGSRAEIRPRAAWSRGRGEIRRPGRPDAPGCTRECRGRAFRTGLTWQHRRVRRSPLPDFGAPNRAAIAKRLVARERHRAAIDIIDDANRMNVSSPPRRLGTKGIGRQASRRQIDLPQPTRVPSTVKFVHRAIGGR